MRAEPSQPDPETRRSPESVGRAPIENCAECGFEWERYSDEEALDVLGTIGTLYRSALDGLDLELANTRPSAECWSILEYVDHVRNAIWKGRFVVDVAVEEPGIDLGATSARIMDPEVKQFASIESTIASMELERDEFLRVLASLEPRQWDCTALVTLGTIDLHWMLRHVLHEALHHLQDVGRIRRPSSS